MQKRDLIVAPIFEGALILVVALAGWVSRQPLLFASLGPTAYEMIETPDRPTARPYNVLVGHLLGVLSAYAALGLTQGWSAPAVSDAGVPLARVWTAVLATVLTVLATLMLRAAQPAAISTTLLIATGVMQGWKDGVLILLAVVLITALGEPVRRWRIGPRKLGRAGDLAHAAFDGNRADGTRSGGAAT